MRLTFLNLLVAAGLAQAAPDPAAIAGLLRADNYADAIPALQAIQSDSEYFAWSIQESARAYFKQERWSEFFGIAYFARHHLPVDREMEKVRLLEVLALLRHCQPDQARDVMTARAYPSDKDLLKDFEIIGELLQIPPTLARDQKPADLTQKPRGVFADNSLWPAKKLAITKLNPHRLRRRVEPLCKEGVR